MDLGSLYTPFLSISLLKKAWKVQAGGVNCILIENLLDVEITPKQPQE